MSGQPEVLDLGDRVAVGGPALGTVCEFLPGGLGVVVDGQQEVLYFRAFEVSRHGGPLQTGDLVEVLPTAGTQALHGRRGLLVGAYETFPVLVLSDTWLPVVVDATDLRRVRRHHEQVPA